MTTTVTAPAVSPAPAHPQRLPVYFISHGGGPWPWMPQMASAYANLATSLADMPRQIGRTPKAVLMVDRERAGREASPTAAIIDSQSVRTGDQKGARAAMTRARRLRGASGTS